MSRETTMQIRLSFEEKRVIQEKSEGWGEPLSAWVRARLREVPAFPLEDEAGTIDEAMAAEKATKPSSTDVVAPAVKKAIATEEELRAKAMELVRTKGISYKAARAEVGHSG